MERERAPQHPGLGKVMVALGLVGLVRLLPEILQIGRTSQYYAMLVTADAVLAVLTGAAGEGLWKGKPWAPRLALRTGGVLLATSLGLGLLMAPILVSPGGVLRLGILARLLYYAVSVAFWPYAVRS